MIGLIQRVSEASVTIDGTRVSEIDRGLLALVAFRQEDHESLIDRFLERLLNYRVFPDPDGRMNLSLRDVGGGLLLVPQFTLAADTGRGNRPSFTPVASPEKGRQLFDMLCRRASLEWPDSNSGRFGADMQVALINDGPVTLWLEVATKR